VRQLVESIRCKLAEGPVDPTRIQVLEQVVRDAVPRLQQLSLCLAPPKPGRYLCYKDPDYGFVIMALVWGCGDGTAIHDHGTWGVEAVLRSKLRVTSYTECEVDPKPLESCVCAAGTVIHNMPPARDVHKVEHAQGAGTNGDVAVSLHIYGREMTGNRMFVPGQGYQHCKLECRELRLEDEAPTEKTLARASSDARR